MLDSLRLLLAQVLALVQTRLELFTTELSAEVQRAVRVLVLAFVALLFGALGLLMLAVTVIVAVWEQHRLLASALVTLVFLGVAALAVWQAWRAVIRGSRLLEATLEELRRDRDALAAVRDRARDTGST
jgi:uncharacterized membrane protein YqjE